MLAHVLAQAQAAELAGDNLHGTPAESPSAPSDVAEKLSVFSILMLDIFRVFSYFGFSLYF